MKHTPGPWCIHRAYVNAPTRTIKDDDGGRWEYTHTYIGQGDKIIAEVQHQSKDSGWPHVHDVGEMWGNAQLMATAPELLDALKTLMEGIEHLDIHGADYARQIVAKAEGRAEP